MATPNDKLVKSEGGEDPVKHLGTGYKDEVESIPEADRLQESSMPLSPHKAPFKLGPLAGGERK